MGSGTNPPLTSRIARLQKLLKGHPRSPLFVRLADCYLEAGDPEHALQTSLEGIKAFPDYGSAHLILAKSLMMLRRYHDAREALKRVMEIQPASGAALELTKRSLELEKKFPSQDRSAHPRVITESDGIPSPDETRRRRWSRQENLIPGSTLFKGSHVSPDSPAEQRDYLDQELDLESLAEKLEHARIPVVEESGGSLQPQEMVTPQMEMRKRPMTETLAAIYMGQGKYDEALRVYEHLLQKHPERSSMLQVEIDRISALRTAEGKGDTSQGNS